MKIRLCGTGADMGMYTNWSLHAELRKDTPPAVIHALDCLTQLDCPEAGLTGPLFDHPFWKADRHRFVCLARHAAYQPAREPLLREDTYSHQWSLFVLASLKNYGDEIGLFVDWLAPYIDTPYGRTYVGWKQYEEDNDPTLLYVHNGEVRWVHPKYDPNEDSTWWTP